MYISEYIQKDVSAELQDAYRIEGTQIDVIKILNIENRDFSIDVHVDEDEDMYRDR